MRRPMLWVFVILILLFTGYRALSLKKDDVRFYIFQDIWEEETSALVQGEVAQVSINISENGGAVWQKEKRQISTCILLKKVQVQLPEDTRVYTLERLIVYLQGKGSAEPGKRIALEGELKEIEPPANPGQFDRKKYYREKNVYYQYQAESMEVLEGDSDKIHSTLYRIRDSMASVYLKALPEKEAGIIKAIVLGDKSHLDMNIKSLYQENGIAHLLAISGLHISILCAGVYNMLLLCRCWPGPAAAVTVFILLAYGRMTDFGISTSRAVIMMILYLLAKWVGRTYDIRSAIAFSGMIILVQMPFALYSSSFLLSFGAMAGIAWILPALENACYGDWEERMQKGKKRSRRWKEIKANHWWGGLAVCLNLGLHKIRSLLLVSVSVQLATLPVLLYFFYEIPVYGIILNLVVIPLASLLVLLGFMGGILGMLWLPLGSFLLGGVYWVLQCYEKVCSFFSSLPGHIWVSGRPSGEKIVIYYGILILLLGLMGWCKRNTWLRYGTLISCSTLLFILIPAPFRGFSMTFLDVGQGDCIFLREESGLSCLVDGGSSTVSSVGTYRILPFLKYLGIRKLDYLIMTHSDNDHISGIIELLENAGEKSMEIGCLLVPDIGNPDAAFQEVVSLAEAKEISVYYMSCGNRLEIGDLQLCCLHPSEGFLDQSANAGSMTLSGTYKGCSFLLTGDLEGRGETDVMDILQRYRTLWKLPERYQILKVAHHGSKHSTQDAFLEQVSPEFSVLSCSKSNRYGHPHPELLQRLRDRNIKIGDIRWNGAITVWVRGEKIEYQSFKEKKR